METAHEDIADVGLISNEELMRRTYRKIHPTTKLNLDDTVTLPVLYASAMEHFDSAAAQDQVNTDLLNPRVMTASTDSYDMERIRDMVQGVL
jgi:hypothetical protein